MSDDPKVLVLVCESPTPTSRIVALKDEVSNLDFGAPPGLEEKAICRILLRRRVWFYRYVSSSWTTRQYDNKLVYSWLEINYSIFNYFWMVLFFA